MGIERNGRDATMMGFLLGFPTPVVEIVAVLAGTVVALAIYYGYAFETVETRDRRVDEGEPPTDDESDQPTGEDVDPEVTG
ncbi:hypothetical protein [Natronorubrum sp. FCH18a]|uniref:hypothetical protein n=1 Tax=Natronorubrum sp. FCH18a TaxID=3447018 RepID=UPI003F518DCA